jgi:hypothetical protein
VVSCYIEREIVKLSFFLTCNSLLSVFGRFRSLKVEENEWTRAFAVSRSLDPNFKRKVVQDKKKREEKNPFVKTRRRKTENVPMVGIVVTISPSLSLYKMVVLPAASRPTCVCVPRL